MSRFLDGPAAGTDLLIRRAPTFLRVVIDPQGKVDALDQLEDEPGDDERIYVYRLEPGTRSVTFLCYRGKDRGRSGRYEIGDYRYVQGVDESVLRTREAWREWAGSASLAGPGAPRI